MVDLLADSVGTDGEVKMPKGAIVENGVKALANHIETTDETRARTEDAVRLLADKTATGYEVKMPLGTLVEDDAKMPNGMKTVDEMKMPNGTMTDDLAERETNMPKGMENEGELMTPKGMKAKEVAEGEEEMSSGMKSGLVLVDGVWDTAGVSAATATSAWNFLHCISAEKIARLQEMVQRSENTRCSVSVDDRQAMRSLAKELEQLQQLTRRLVESSDLK